MIDQPITDVFFCTASMDPYRVAIAAQCAQRWAEEPGIRMMGLSPAKLQCSLREFQRTRRMAADQLAESSIYVVADDDSLLPPSRFVEPMLDLMRRYPEFAMLVPLPSNAPIERWTERENYPKVYTPEVMEHVSVGQIRFCRKGLLRDWPPMSDSPGYDLIHAEALRRLGFRVGYARTVNALHLGEGHSTLWGSVSPVLA